MAQVWVVLGDLATAEQLLVEAVALDKAFGFAALARDEAALAQVRDLMYSEA